MSLEFLDDDPPDTPHYRLLKTLREEQEQEAERLSGVGGNFATNWVDDNKVDNESLMRFLVEISRDSTRSTIRDLVLGGFVSPLSSDMDALTMALVRNGTADLLQGFILGYSFALDRPDAP